MVSKRTLSISIVVLCGVLLTAHGFQFDNSKPKKSCCLRFMKDSEKSKNVSPGNCTDITITYTISNFLTNTQNFKHSIRVRHPQDVLIRFMEKAVVKNLNFKFSANYHYLYGYFISSINNLEGNWKKDKTWWKIIRMPNETLPVGVSSFIPEDNDHILFKYVRGFENH